MLAFTRRWVAAVATGWACLVLVPALHADALVIGEPATGSNAFPFGGAFPGNPGTRYQQVYNASLFPGIITISEITFFHTQSPGGTINPSTYEFHLSTTPRLVNGLDTTNFDANVGANDQLFRSLALSGNPGPTLTISGESFVYDPSQGNLLLDIFISPGGPTGFTILFDSRNGDFGADSSRAHNFGTQFDSTGLVTQFTFTPGVIPEPASLTLVGMGIASLGAYTWRRRRQTV